MAKFVSVVIDKIFIKEELFLINILEHFVGYSDIGDINNHLADYETENREVYASFMVRCKEFKANLIPLIRKTIKHLMCLVIIVVAAITCNTTIDI